MEQKTILKQGMIGLLYSIIIIMVLRWLKLDMVGMVMFFNCLAVGHYVYRVIRKKEAWSIGKFIKTILKTSATMLLILYLIRWLGAYGIIGFILIIFILAGWRIIRNKKMYMDGLRNIESMIWGKPLDKKEWKKDEFKNTKIKIVMNKNGHSDNNN